jgi:DNA-binding NtrC family response regulator
MSAHILFVDDEVPIRETLSVYFKTKGMKVTTAETGAEAIRLSTQIPFSLVILDVKLGNESGLDLLDRFKQTHPRLPVIMFTSMDDDPDLLKTALDKGACAYMSKSESLNRLMKEVERAIQSESVA